VHILRRDDDELVRESAREALLRCACAIKSARRFRKLPDRTETSASGNFRISRKLPHQQRRSVEDRVLLAQPKPPSGWKLPKLPAMLNAGVAAARGRRLVRCLAPDIVGVGGSYPVSTP
jgi:hypothetical protein